MLFTHIDFILEKIHKIYDRLIINKVWLEFTFDFCRDESLFSEVYSASLRCPPVKWALINLLDKNNSLRPTKVRFSLFY